VPVAFKEEAPFSPPRQSFPLFLFLKNALQFSSLFLRSLSRFFKSSNHLFPLRFPSYFFSYFPRSEFPFLFLPLLHCTSDRSRPFFAIFFFLTHVEDPFVFPLGPPSCSDVPAGSSAYFFLLFKSFPTNLFVLVVLQLDDGSARRGLPFFSSLLMTPASLKP